MAVVSFVVKLVGSFHVKGSTEFQKNLGISWPCVVPHHKIFSLYCKIFKTWPKGVPVAQSKGCWGDWKHPEGRGLFRSVYQCAFYTLASTQLVYLIQTKRTGPTKNTIFMQLCNFLTLFKKNSDEYFSLYCSSVVLQGKNCIPVGNTDFSLKMHRVCIFSKIAYIQPQSTEWGDRTKK